MATALIDHYHSNNFSLRNSAVFLVYLELPPLQLRLLHQEQYKVSGREGPGSNSTDPEEVNTDQPVSEDMCTWTRLIRCPDFSCQQAFIQLLASLNRPVTLICQHVPA